MSDAIRTIQKDTSMAHWAITFGLHRERAGWRFSYEPQGIEVGELLFFAVHGRVQAVGTYQGAKWSERRQMYVVTTTDNLPIDDYTLEFKGYAQLRYLDELPDQYEGRYSELVKKLRKIAKRYRAGTFEPKIYAFGDT